MPAHCLYTDLISQGWQRIDSSSGVYVYIGHLSQMATFDYVTPLIICLLTLPGAKAN